MSECVMFVKCHAVTCTFVADSYIIGVNTFTPHSEMYGWCKNLVKCHGIVIEHQMRQLVVSHPVLGKPMDFDFTTV